MGAEVLIASLLSVAKDDLEAARRLSSPVNRNAIYHCEQAAEKIIKAVLTSEGIHAGVRHQLSEMVDSIPDANPVKPTLRAIEDLQAYATTYRYPTAGGRIPHSPDQQAVLAAATKVETALAIVAARFGVDLSKANAPAANATPIR